MQTVGRGVGGLCIVKCGVAYKVVSYARRVRQELVVVRMKEVSREELYTTVKYGRVCPMSRGSSNAGHR